MTTPDERYRALTWARELMEELRASQEVSADIRRQAVVVLRHLPRKSDLDHACVLIPNWIAAPTEHGKD